MTAAIVTSACLIAVASVFLGMGVVYLALKLDDLIQLLKDSWEDHPEPSEAPAPIDYRAIGKARAALHPWPPSDSIVSFFPRRRIN